MADDLEQLTAELHAGRERFLELVNEVRPSLHRYCARMTGSISAGEDIVQETLAHAYYALSEVMTLPPIRSWLFQIAHRKSIDYLRRYDRRMGQPLEVIMETAADEAEGPEDALARDEAVRAALSAFLDLAPAQRSCVILKDVLGHSLEEIADLLETTVPTVKAALHRGRTRLRSLKPNPAPESRPPPPSPDIARYIQLFNARDWEGVRAMLAEEVRLDLVSKQTRAGKREVSGYLTNYGKVEGWRLAAAVLDGQEVIAVFRESGDSQPGYFIQLEFKDGRVRSIKDFRYVPYIAAEANLELA